MRPCNKEQLDFEAGMTSASSNTSYTFGLDGAYDAW